MWMQAETRLFVVSLVVRSATIGFGMLLGSAVLTLIGA